MTGADETVGRDPVDALVEEFLLRHRRGETVVVADFAKAHPEHAAVLHEVLPTLVALEQVRRDRASTTGRGLPKNPLPAFERLGDFRIVREIGRGGMGVVFEAMQESLGRRVALKVLPQAALLTGNQLQRFQREAQIASQLHHSNIVPVFGSGESDGFHWYAMQFIAGQSLDRWRETQAAAPPNGSGAWRDRARQVARFGVQAAQALHHAHTQGTLHRDIKPGNLLLETGEHGDHVWVTDFGLAKALEAEGLTHSGDLLGTLQYMAPEQFAGHYDVRSEVYALGITLYELLVLRPAFAAKTRSELMEMIRTRPPHALRQASPEVPEDLAIVVERAMARDPADRYGDAAAFAADLGAFLEDRPIAARRHTALQLVWRWCRRNRAMATLAACTLLAVLGAAITGWTAYVVTDEALQATDDALAQAKKATATAQQKSRLVESNLALTLDAFGDVFDALVGRDPAQALEEDPDTGETAVVARTVEPRDIALLQQMLAFYDRFAAENESSESLRLETARAHRRTGTIQARLGNLDEAAASYDKALERLRAVTTRDVKREIADLHVAQGQIEQRRRRPAEAAQRFRLALDLLGVDRPDDPRALRFQRAEVHFLLAGSPLAGVEQGRRPGPERARNDARRELEAARTILVQLLAQEPENPEFQALHARCLMFASRPRGGAGERDNERDQEREADRQAGITIFRTLVAAHPDVDQYAMELCSALLYERRPGSSAPRDAGSIAAEVERLTEANALAKRLLELQPDFEEYQSLRIRTGTRLGGFLARTVSGDGDVARATRATAEAELRAALRLSTHLQARPAPPDVPLLMETFVASAALATVLADSDRLDDARTAATDAVAVLQKVTEVRRRGRMPRPSLRLLEDVRSVLQRAGLAEAVQQLEALREKLPPEERPDRGSADQPPRRR